MSAPQPQTPHHDTILDEAWNSVVGGLDWLKSVLIGEFADHRPLSAVVADMLVSFVPGVVIVTSARDAVAVTLRLAQHPEKRTELMEWVLLCACLITLALPLAMAAGGAAAAGVGAIVGGIAGSELGAALRAVMLLLIKEATKLIELMRFLQKFVKGDILKFLRAIKFAQYEKVIVQALGKVTGKLLDVVKALRGYLESLSYFDRVKATIAKLAEWEKKFYAVQQDALTQIPKALTELDARLAKVLAQTAPKEAHTVAAGAKVEHVAAEAPKTQRVADATGQSVRKLEKEASKTKAPKNTEPKPQSKPTGKGKASPKPPEDKPPLKDKADPTHIAHDGKNTKKQEIADPLVAAERERITQLSKEAQEAEKRGDKALAAAKIEEARGVLRPYLPKNPGDSWEPIVQRLDVSSPKDGAVFWSGTAGQARTMGQPDAARVFAEKMGGVTLETTPGGRIIDDWDEVNKGYPWNADSGPPPWSSDLWSATSEKYASGVSGNVNVVQTPDRLWDPRTIWSQQEKPLLLDAQELGKVSNINVHVVDGSGETHLLSPSYTEELLKFDQKP